MRRRGVASGRFQLRHGRLCARGSAARMGRTLLALFQAPAGTPLFRLRKADSAYSPGKRRARRVVRRLSKALRRFLKKHGAALTSRSAPCYDVNMKGWRFSDGSSPLIIRKEAKPLPVGAGWRLCFNGPYRRFRRLFLLPSGAGLHSEPCISLLSL